MDSDLIKLVNKLQDTFANLGGELDMPQLAVVGSQSAGKSSVLETIVGRDFLPRGQGIVTRRPLVLQLIHTPAPSPSSDPSSSEAPSISTYTEWGQFLHVNKRFTDFNEIRKEIEQETFRVAGQNKGISKLPINLRIYSPNVLDLTLVDLPGLTKIPVGDQPSDIERQIRNLVVDYISKPNCVILSVSAANVDLANSESLKLARTVDPQGRRTIGVLTKLDLMDAGTNANDILTGRTYPLKLGFIGVVNRSQQDINTEKPMSAALDSEQEFFATHPAYRNIAHKQGTKYLARTLNQVLMNHIRDKIPDMKARLNTLMGQAQQELSAFGDEALFGDKNQQGSIVLRLMTQFARDFVSSIDGTNFEISTKELSGGARIYYIFHDVFGNALANLDATGNLGDQDIRTAIRNSAGPRPSLFVPEVAFDLLVKPQIKLLESPSSRCVELVYEELVKICHNCTSLELQRFPSFHARVVDVVSELLRERLGPTSDYTQSLIDIQSAYINTNHPSFMVSAQNAAAAHTSSPKHRQSLPPRPQSAEPLSNIGMVSLDMEDEDDSSTTTDNILNGLNGVNGGLSTTAGKHHHSQSTRNSTSSTSSQQHHHHHNSSRRTDGERISSSSSSTSTAKESFLNYFFGQNGPGPVAGANITEGHGHLNRAGGTVGRDVSGPDYTTGAFARTKNGPVGDGCDAAFDMKSLGRHIEATSLDGGSQLSLKEEMEVNMIRSLISSYFSIVRQSIQDLVPKAIMHLLVNHTSQHVQDRLVSTLYKPEIFSELLHEDESLVSERARVKALLDAYKDAFKILSEVSLKSG
ncbi:dynamin protein dnm1 [Thelephora terrestris]|uniref:Dynamin protein dnm1 n=1 Tax=Thelephora terrestris TaxID=56493 RepID=A0A9P6HEC1_9AGAM|nr:dynamin protein dnm1 [Thelephora terrestris]